MAPGRARTIAGVAAAVFLASCGNATQTAATSRPAVEPIPVTVLAPRTTTFRTPVDLSGTLAARRTVTVGAVSAGRIVAFDARVGDRVAGGTVLARVDAAGYEAGLAVAQAGIAAASQSQAAAAAQVTAAKTHLAFAQTTANRMDSLYAEGAISKQQRDEARANVDAAAAGVQGASAGFAASGSLVSQARSGAAAAGVPVSNALVTAPFDGIVTSVSVERGAVVGPGSPIVTIEDANDLELDVAVPNDDLSAIAPGDAVAVTVGAAGNHVAGRVRAIVPMNDVALRSALVKIDLARSTGLMSGMFARVTMSTGIHQGTAVPLAALVTRAGQSGVFGVRDGVARFFPVQTGTVGPASVEVRGLPAGATRIAVTNVQRLTDGAAVTVTR